MSGHDRKKCLAVAVALTTFSAGTPTWSQSYVAPYETGLRRAAVLSEGPPERLALADRMARWKVSGLSVAIIDDCRIVDARGFGVTARNGTPVAVDTLFQAASVSKPVAAYVALRLVENDILTLDDDIGPQLKVWRLPPSPLLKDNPVTLRGLLSHNAGLGPSGYGGYPRGSALPTLIQTLNGEAPARPKPVEVKAQPGSGWSYSGGGYLVAEQLMIDVTGRPFPALALDIALTPLGMSHSSFVAPAADATNVALGHGADGAPVEGGWHLYPEHAAAGLWSTPSDLARFTLDVMMAGRGSPNTVLGNASADLMIEPAIGPRSLGFVVGGAGTARRFGHDGTNEGYNAMLIAYPETCQGAILMANSDNAKPLMSEVVRAIADVYGWPDPMPSDQQTGTPLTPALIERFVGRYQFVTLPDVPPFAIAGTLDDGFTFERGDGFSEPLIPTTEGLLGPDSGILITASDPDALQTPSITYRRLASTSGAEARRVTAE